MNTNLDTLQESIPHGSRKYPMDVFFFDQSIQEEAFFVERHWHDYMEIIYIKEGEFTIEINLDTHNIYPGDIVIMNPEDLHQIRGKAKNTIHYAILFDLLSFASNSMDAFQEEIIQPLLLRQKRFAHVIHPCDTGYTKLKDIFLTAYQASVSKSPFFYLETRLEIERFLIFSYEYQFYKKGSQELSASDKLKVDRFKQILSFLESNYQKPLQLKDIAQYVGINQQYLCRFFKETSGMSVMDYLLHIRLEKAKEKIRTSTLTILEIALECGFSSDNYFIRKFKELEGITPKKYQMLLNRKYSKKNTSHIQ